MHEIAHDHDIGKGKDTEIVKGKEVSQTGIELGRNVLVFSWQLSWSRVKQ